MTKKIISFLICSALVLSVLLIKPTDSKAISGNESTYTYWMQSSSTYLKTSYGSWGTVGGAFVGPGTYTKTYKSNTGYSVEVSASIPVKKIDLGLALGFTKEKEITTTASRKVPAGKKAYFQKRNVYKHYKVKMVEWISIDGRKSKTGKVKYVTIKKKDNLESRITLK